jgi:hypothetical protein
MSIGPRALAVALSVASCAQGVRSVPDSVATAPETNAMPPSRDEVVAYARRYVDAKWLARADNVFHGEDPDGVRLDTPDVGQVAGGWSVGENTGVAYQWGGFDTPETFARKVSLGWPAGHAELTRTSPASQRAAGIDCSGLVARSWGLARKVSTRELPALTLVLPGYSRLCPGDILNKVNAHVLLFEGFADPEQSRAKVIEAGSRRGGAWRVVESEYAVDSLERFGFVPLRDKRRPASEDCGANVTSRDVSANK